ncbi:N-acetylglucosamine-6-phosphate deacetylase [Eubacterium plexicaudatum ASF492]|uniref:N-acetylglucosamine-6-phosphate deacetylase n=1 Tax=Eubacterium plexicaudatum ASF492 TaxID=1235802 RepID=N2A8F5_9FIRM|nr:N-acetylglucosamine-6-phosphate deacetylase [Eubacterium plexicaudatum ASF492]
MIIEHVKVYTKDNTFQEGTISIQNGVFSDTSDSPDTIDGKGCYAIPGLIDLHFHGCGGYDLCDNSIEAIAKIAEQEACAGITGICPATMTLPYEELLQILRTAAAYRKECSEQKESKKGADLIGINMEGPFISTAKKGAQDPKHILPCDVKIAENFIRASEGLVKFIGIAPEDNPDFVSFIAQLKEQVSISLAHTNADYDTAMAAFQAGANHAVHLYNAMPPMTHRAPGVIGAVSDSPHVYAEIICDGIHIHPSVVRATFRMLGTDRMILISDSMRAAGMPNGRYTLGGLDVNVTDRKVTLVSDGALAGSASNLMECMRTAVTQMGIPLETAVACASVNPAKCLGVYEERGSIEPGKIADLVLLDESLAVQMVLKNGNRIR